MKSIQISFLVLLALLTITKRSYTLPTSSNQKTRPPNGTSLINQVLPTEVEREVDTIKSCEPTLTLMNGRKKDIAFYVTSKYGGGCLDNTLFLELSVRGLLRDTLSRGDKKADIIVCHEFVELFKAVELKGLTKAMCTKGVISEVSDEFCTPSEDVAESKAHDDTVLEKLRTRDLIQIAVGFQLLRRIRGDERCLRVCGGNDKVFCNAYVRLTEFFLNSTKEPDEQQPSDKDADTLFDRIKISLESESVPLNDLKELRATIDDASNHVFRYKLHEVFPFMLPDQLETAVEDTEIMKFILDSVIKKRAKSQALFPQQFKLNNSPSFGDKGGNKGTLDDTENDSDYNFVNRGLNRHDSTKHQVGGDGEYQSDHNNDDVTYWLEQNDQLPERIDGQARIDQLTDHKDHLIAGLKHKDELKPQTIVNDEEQGGGDGQQPVDDDDPLSEKGLDKETELFSQIETQLLKEKDEDKQPPGQLSEDQRQKKTKNEGKSQFDAAGGFGAEVSSKHAGYGSWHFLSIFLFFGATVVIGYLFIVKRKKLREGLGSYITDANKSRKRTRDYRPLRST